MTVRKISEKKMNAGSTLSFVDASTLYSGKYVLKISNKISERSYPIVVGTP